MRRCPHCKKTLLATKERLPEKISPMQTKILEFCSVPRKSVDIAAHIGSSMSGTYKSLRLLQRLNQIKKVLPEVSRGHNYDITFVATGNPVVLNETLLDVIARPMVMGVRL